MQAASSIRQWLQRSDLAAALMLLLCIALGAVIQIARSAYRIRRTYRLQVRPEVIQTKVEHLPFAFRAVLGQLTQELAAMGFTAAANVAA